MTVAFSHDSISNRYSRKSYSTRLWKVKQISRKLSNHNVEQASNSICAFVGRPVIIPANDLLVINQ